METKKCNICGKEVNGENKYSIPTFKRTYAMHNNKRVLSFDYGISPSKVSLCNEDAQLFAELYDKLKQKHDNEIGHILSPVQIVDKRATGKSVRLMKLAKENDAVIVCMSPHLMAEKAHNHGVEGVGFISYNDYSAGNYPKDKLIYIDEVECYLRFLGNKFSGYSLSIE